MAGTTKNVMAFAVIIFILLGVAFGAQIMTFIFAQLGPDNAGLTISDPGYNESLDVQNNSLTGIVDYTAQTSTQMTTVAIAVTLVILIALFAVFWKFFVGTKKGGIAGGNFG